jgi:hypothetical protein
MTSLLLQMRTIVESLLSATIKLSRAGNAKIYYISILMSSIYFTKYLRGKESRNHSDPVVDRIEYF